MPNGEEKSRRFDQFKRENTFLEQNGQLFVLDVNSLEDYYPKKLTEACSRRDKVKKAKWMAREITQEQFEQQMTIMYSAVCHCWDNAYVSDLAAPDGEGTDDDEKLVNNV